jgi:hypothetical protein
MFHPSSDNLRVVRVAQRGSDVYGVLERITRLRHASCLSESDEQSMPAAQEFLAGCGISCRYCHTHDVNIKLPWELTATLKDYAHAYYRKRRDAGQPESKELEMQDWFKALDEVAALIHSRKTLQ